MSSTSQVRLYCILARKSSLGVVFRRGPSRRVLLLSWDTRTDSFDAGQWLKGRIYERRCDLSPSGSHLIYFAAKYTEPLWSWTAVSRPPYLSAIALWPKGDAWGGGGLFESDSTVLLNHSVDEILPMEGSAPPAHVEVRPFGDRPGVGEDDPILTTRLHRDGWRTIQTGTWVKRRGSRNGYDLDPPLVMTKRRPPGSGAWELRSELVGLQEQGGPWYVTRHDLVDEVSGRHIAIGRSDWADWCHRGDLLFARDGKLFRLNPDRDSRAEEARLLNELTNISFHECEPPDEALRW